MQISEAKSIEIKNGVPFVVWCYWDGKKMNANRSKSFDYLVNNIGVPLFLITPKNLDQFIKKDFPLPASFPYLSIVHQSDYIRAYMLHHYGGGWHDIKATKTSFGDCWDLFEDKSIWIIGSPEVKNGAAPIYDSMGRYMPDYYEELIAVPRWIGRPHTPLSSMILENLNAELNNHKHTLKRYPAKHAREKYIHPKNSIHKFIIWIKQRVAGRNHKYPLPWTLFGNSFHPAVLKFERHVARSLPIDSVKNAGLYHR